MRYFDDAQNVQDPDPETAGRGRKLAIVVLCVCAVVLAATVWTIIDRRF